MITVLNFFNYQYEIIINFVAHFFIFIGTFYVALQNRKLPQWHVTPLWYMGIFAFLTCVSIVCQWSMGSEFPLSYYNIGQLCKTLVSVSIGVVALIMLTTTVKKDIKESKKRRHLEA